MMGRGRVQDGSERQSGSGSVIIRGRCKENYPPVPSWLIVAMMACVCRTGSWKLEAGSWKLGRVPLPCVRRVSVSTFTIL